MRGQTVSAAAVAVLVLLAGCSAGVGTDGESFGETAGPPTGTGSIDGTAASGMVGGVASTVGTGTVSFYLSDRPSAIGDFEHLTVTVTRVEFHYAGPTGGAEVTSTEPPAVTVTETPNGTTAGTPDVNATETPTATATPAPTATVTPDGNATAGNGTTDGTETPPPTDAAAGSPDPGWIAFDVDDREADLTELTGPNATLIGDYDLPAGTYTTVRVTVSGINASLAGTGERVRVKLPSGRLKLNRPFTVGSGDAVDFVFDISVHRAGNSGKYILTPVIGESGTDVPITDVDNASARGGPPAWAGAPDDTRRGPPGRDAEVEVTGIDAAFQGPVRANGTATVRVHGDRGPLAGATVAVNGSTVGETGHNGRLSFAVPAGDHLVATVTYGNATVTVEAEVVPARGGGPPDDRGEGNARKGGKASGAP